MDKSLSTPHWADKWGLAAQVISAITTIIFGVLTLYVTWPPFQKLVDDAFFPRLSAPSTSQPTLSPTPLVPKLSQKTLPKREKNETKTDLLESSVDFSSPAEEQGLTQPQSNLARDSKENTAPIDRIEPAFSSPTDQDKQLNSVKDPGDAPSTSDFPIQAPVIIETLTVRETKAFLVYKVEPEYPKLALDHRLWGTVEVDITVLEDGTVGGIHPRSGNPILVDAVQKAVRQWRFEPARIGDEPVISTIYRKFTFQPKQ